MNGPVGGFLLLWRRPAELSSTWETGRGQRLIWTRRHPHPWGVTHDRGRSYATKRRCCEIVGRWNGTESVGGGRRMMGCSSGQRRWCDGAVWGETTAALYLRRGPRSEQTHRTKDWCTSMYMHLWPAHLDFTDCFRKQVVLAFSPCKMQVQRVGWSKSSLVGGMTD